MKGRAAEVGTAIRISLNVFAQALKLSPAYVLKVAPVWPACRCLVQVSGNSEALPGLLRHPLCDGHAICEGDAADGDEGNHIRGSEARVGAAVPVQVDQFRSLADAAQGSFPNRLALAHQRDHAPIVIGIHFAVEQVNVWS